MLLRVSIAKAGEDVSRCPEFTKPEVTIGRRPTNDVILPDDGVSGSHARILVTGRTLTLVDQGSTNGTFVGGERVDGPRTVGPRDEVLISDYRLTFSLVDESSADDGVVRTPVPPGGTAEVPLSEALGWSDEGGELPPPPPMLDAPVAIPTPPTSPAPAAAAGYPVYPPPKPPSRPVAGPMPAAMPVSVPGSVDDVAFDFDPRSPQSLHEQIFGAVWSRVAEDVIVSAPGVDARVQQLLDRAISAASRIGSLASGTREQIHQEMLTSAAVQTLLKGEPDDVLVLGTQGVRVDRRGHVSIGPSPVSCNTALVALGSRLCGVVVDQRRPVARKLHGSYVAQMVHGSVAGGVPVLSLRRPPTLPSSFEELESSGAVSSTHANILRAAVRAGLRLVLCVAPGVAGRPVLGALMSAAASNELQVVVAPPGSDMRNLRTGTVLLTRGPDRDAMGAALALGPSRLALEDIPWGDVQGLDVLTSSSVRVIASIRARNPWVGLQRLVTMLERSQGMGGSPSAFIASSIDLFVTVGSSRDGTPQITALTEPLATASGEVELSELTTYDPQTQAWVARLGASPCLDDLVHRGLLDPRVFQTAPTTDPNL